jgi:very-long-chain enoyl-CoA reductase
MAFFTYPSDVFDLIFKSISYVIIGGLIFYIEYKSKFNMSYSKFRKGNNFSSKVGMTIIYLIPLLVYYYSYMLFKFPSSIYHYSLLTFVTIHFGKRILEVLFLHKFSGGMSLFSVIMICIFYSNVTWVVGQLVNGIISPIGIDFFNSPNLWIGSVLFIIGIFGNLFHHIILAKLRSENMKSYLLPSTYGFKYVICPHYTFELCIWLGIAISSTFIDIYFIFFVMICYLSARGMRTMNWYKETFKDKMIQKNILIPRIF